MKEKEMFAMDKKLRDEQAKRLAQGKHTPGPWRTGDRFNTVFGPNLGKPSPVTIAAVFRGNEANARLIAAAPDMLQTLREELEAIRVWLAGETNADITDGMLISIDKIQRAIAKAEGRML